MLNRTIAWTAESHCWDDLVDDRMRTVYAAYRRDLGIGARPAVLAIDLYDVVFAGGPLEPADLQATHPSSCGRYAHQALPAIRSTFAAAREHGLPVVHVTFDRAWHGAGAGTNRQTEVDDEAEWEFHPDCAPRPGEVVVRKVRASAFFGTPLVTHLIRQGVDTLIVVGESTSGCVRASVVDAYSHGFHVVVVEDGVFDRSWLNHRVNLFDLHHKYADVISAAAVGRLLAATS